MAGDELDTMKEEGERKGYGTNRIEGPLEEILDVNLHPLEAV